MDNYENIENYTEAEKENVSNSKDENTKKLIEEYNSLHLYDSKIEDVFEAVFENSNSKIAMSIMNAILPSEEIIDEVKFINPDFISTPVKFNKKGVIVDLHFRNSINRKSYLIEMQIHKEYEYDSILGAEFNVFRVYEKLIEKDRKFIINGKVSSIKFIYYDMFENDKFYHHINISEGIDTEKVNEPIKCINESIEISNNHTESVKEKNDGKENSVKSLKSSFNHKSKIIVIELRKFKKKLTEKYIKSIAKFSEEIDNDKKEIKEKEKQSNNTKEEIDDIENKKNDVQEREKKLKLHLWLAFFSKVNTIYEDDPNYDPYERIYDEYDIEFIIKNKEFNFELYQLFKKYDEIMDAINIFRAPIDGCIKNESIEYISKADEYYYINQGLKEELEEIDKKLEEKDKENKRQREELEEKDKKLEEKDKENKRQREELEEMRKKMKMMEALIQNQN